MAIILQKSFSRQFLDKRFAVFSLNSTEVFSEQEFSIGLDNVFALNRWQAIIWTSGGIIYWGIYLALCLD